MARAAASSCATTANSLLAAGKSVAGTQNEIRANDGRVNLPVVSNIALGAITLDMCPNADSDGDRLVDVVDLLRAVAAALSGECGQ